MKSEAWRITNGSKIYIIYIYVTYSVTGSSGLEGEMESDMVVAVRHRDVPGDLTRSSTCNKISRVLLLFVTLMSSFYENCITFWKFITVASATCEFFHVAIGGRKHGEGEAVEFFARYLLPSMGNWATGRADMSSRHHARQSTRVIHCISELSEAPFFSARAQTMKKQDYVEDTPRTLSIKFINGNQYNILIKAKIFVSNTFIWRMPVVVTNLI